MKAKSDSSKSAPVRGRAVPNNKKIVRAGDGKGNDFGSIERKRGRVRGDGNVTRYYAPATKPRGKKA